MTSRAYTPFTVLNYLITKATVEGTNDKAVVRVPYADLLASIGKKVETEEDFSNSELDLVISIELNWEEHVEDDEQAVEIDVDFTEDYKD